MKQNNEKSLKNIGIQFFADEPAPTEPPADPDPPAPTEPKPAEPPATKTYTQEQINTMMANEKRTARQAIFKELGFEFKDDKSYKEVLKGIKQTLDAGKTQAQLDAEAKATAEAAQAEAESKAAMLEIKVEALSAGANPKYLDDLIALVMTKVSDTNTPKMVLEALKPQYPVFFDGDEGSSGTGSPTNPRRVQNNGQDGLGKRLAKAHKTTVKSSYFKT